MVLLATAAPRRGDGLAFFSLLAASARRPSAEHIAIDGDARRQRVRPIRHRLWAYCDPAGFEEKLEARSFCTSALLPRVFVTNGLATSGSRVAQAQVATLAVARMAKRGSHSNVARDATIE
jgi:hypothetical protein